LKHTARMPSTPHPLDNVVWSALTSAHAPLALGGELARRYPPPIAGFVALRDGSTAAQAALAALVAPGEEVLMLSAAGLAPGAAFEITFQKELVQMIAPTLAGEPRDATRFEPLGDADIPQMLALVEQTQPGPFRERTIDFGGFLGHKVDGGLVAMGGRRMQLSDFVEVSGICTDPGFRGQGLARDLVLILARRIAAEGRTPMLHAFGDNQAAIALYEKLGFVLRARPLAMRLRRRD
jgi:ribosomal protein S18 acetylase RimI-like enzyme